MRPDRLKRLQIALREVTDAGAAVGPKALRALLDVQASLEADRDRIGPLSAALGQLEEIVEYQRALDKALTRALAVLSDEYIDAGGPAR